MWQVWLLPSRCLPSSLPVSTYLSVNSLSVSFPLITSPFFLSFAFHAFCLSLTSSHLHSLALLLVSLGLHGVPALMQLLITKPLIWSLNLPNLKNRRGRNEAKKKDRSRSSHHLVRWWEEKRKVFQSVETRSQRSTALRQSGSGLDGDWLSLITLSYKYSCYSCHTLSPLWQCMNTEERISKLLSALTYSQWANTQSQGERKSVKCRKQQLIMVCCTVHTVSYSPLTMKASSILKAFNLSVGHRGMIWFVLSFSLLLKGMLL